MNWKSDFISDSNRKIHYYHNENSKPPLILLHGAMDNGLCWWIPPADKLAEKYFVIMPDARGHGLTETSKDETFSFDLMADDIAFIIQKLNLVNPQLVGHSMGANVAALVAAKYPDLIHKAVLEDPAFLIEKFPKYSKPLVYLIMMVVGWVSLKGSYEKILKRGKKLNPTWPEEIFKPWAESKVQYKEKNKYFLLGMFKMRYLWREYLQSIKCPILLISSSKGILSDKLAKEALELNKDAKWVKIDDAKHNIRREQPVKFMEALDDFLD